MSGNIRGNIRIRAIRVKGNSRRLSDAFVLVLSAFQTLIFAGRPGRARQSARGLVTASESLTAPGEGELRNRPGVAERVVALLESRSRLWPSSRRNRRAFQPLRKQRGQQEIEVDQRNSGVKPSILENASSSIVRLKVVLEHDKRAVAGRSRVPGERIAGRQARAAVIGVPGAQVAVRWRWRHREQAVSEIEAEVRRGAVESTT